MPDEIVVEATDTAIVVESVSSEVLVVEVGNPGEKGADGAPGAQGPSGVIAVTSPITNSGTATSANIGINQAALTVAQSQVTNLVTDLATKPDTNTLLESLQYPVNVTDTISRTAGINNTLVLTSGTVAYYFFTPTRTVTISSITMATIATASAGLTLARIGLFTFDGTTATLVARTASDTTLFNATFTNYTRSLNTTGGFPATYTLTAGTRYGLGVIAVGTTMPAIACGPFVPASLVLLTPRMTAIKASQTDLATVTTFSNLTAQIWGRMS